VRSTRPQFLITSAARAASTSPTAGSGADKVERASPLVSRPSDADPEPEPDAEPEPEARSDPDAGSDSGPGADPHADNAGVDATVIDLVARAQAGDAAAFGEIYDRYVGLIYRYIYYRVGSQTLAEDLTSETFLRALRRFSSFTWQGRDVGAWFVTIARNLVTDHFKSSRYRLEVATSDMIATAGDEPGTSTPESEVLSHLTNETLLTAVRQLNSEQQECIVLRFLQGLSVSETALAMGKNDGAIKALQYRAVKSLGRLLPDGVF
jgi:RNA polymerase sigma-70 factor (ECF subfamily)